MDMSTLFSCVPRLSLVFRQLQKYYSIVKIFFLDMKGGSGHPTPPPLDTALIYNYVDYWTEDCQRSAPWSYQGAYNNLILRTLMCTGSVTASVEITKATPVGTTRWLMCTVSEFLEIFAKYKARGVSDVTSGWSLAYLLRAWAENSFFE